MESLSLSSWRHGGEFNVSDFDMLTFGLGQPLSTAEDRLLDLMQLHFENAAAFSVTITGLTDPMREWLEHDRGSLPHLDLLLTSTAAKAASPDMYASGSPFLGTFAQLPPLLLAGHLAQHLYAGGAYSPQITQAQAAAAGNQFVNEKIADSFDDFHVAVSAGWSDWFIGDGWDTSWAITNVQTGAATLFCSTDTS